MIVARSLREDACLSILRLSVHVVNLTASIAMIQENISLLRANTRRSVPSFPFSVPTSVRLGVFLVKIWKHTGRIEMILQLCEYYSVGCEARMARKDQEKHKKENMEEHLMKTQSKLTDTTNQLTIALQRITTLEATMGITVTRTTVIESSLRWSVKLAAMAMMSKSGDQVCPVILKMSNYSAMKMNNDIWCTDSFLTDDQGYKICATIYPAGYKTGKGTHLSCYLHLMKGPHDDNLPWPLRNKLKIRLLNQISDSQHHNGIVNYAISIIVFGRRITVGDKGGGYGKPPMKTSTRLLQHVNI